MSHKRERQPSPVGARRRWKSTRSAVGLSNRNSSSEGDREDGPRTSSSESPLSSLEPSPKPSTIESGSETSSGQSPLSPEHTSPPGVTIKASTCSQSAVVARSRTATIGLATPETIREASHDGTIVSPYVANNFQYPVVTSLTRYIHNESFPAFQTGNVFIKTELTSPPKHWQLHSDVLARQSSFFAGSMRKASDEKGELPTWFSYAIVKDNLEVVLIRQQASGKQPSIGAPATSTMNEIAVKVEDAENTTISARGTLSSPLKVKDYTYTIDLYDQIFGVFYNIPALIPTNNIITALNFAEQLTKIASTMDCLHLIRPYTNAALLNYRQTLFTSIASDPARWLLLSLTLHNEAIYTEALIHLSGAHPSWPSTWPTERSNVPPEIRRLVATKSRELDQTCLQAERDLLLLTINVHNGPVQFHQTSDFDTWFIVNTFRDILAQEFTALEAKRDAALHRGTMFRKIRKGGSAYMDYETMRGLMERVMPSAVGNLSEDLAMLKGEAREYVKELARNELMLDIEAEGIVVGYLTCVKVGKEDIPWRAEVDGADGLRME